MNLTPQQINARQTVPKELPRFSGNPEEWPIFISTYNWSTAVCGLTDAENLVRLQRALHGDALRSVQHILIHPTCVPEAISTLRLLFGQPEKILNAIRNKISLVSRAYSNKLESITCFAIEVKGLKTTIEACGLYEELNNSSLLQDLITKMSPDLQLMWGTFKMQLLKENKKTNLSAFADWLFDVGVSASSINISESSATSTSTQPFSRGKARNAYVHTHSDINRNNCLVCSNDCESVSNCERFLSADRNERWNIVRECKLCKLCLRKHYGFCKSNIVCGINNCHIKHNSLLHKNEEVSTEVERSNQNRINVNQPHNVNAHRSTFNQVLFKILPISIFGQNNKCIKTFAFIDEGSSVSLINEKLINQLNLVGEPESLCLKWTNNMQINEDSSKKLSIKLSGPNNKHRFVEVRSVKYLSLPSQSIDYKNMSQLFPHLKGLPIAEYKNAVPEVLIGLNNINLCIPNRIKEGRRGEPTAIRTRLGWMLCGNMSGELCDENFTCMHVSESGRWFKGPDFLKMPEKSWHIDKKDEACTEAEIRHREDTGEVLRQNYLTSQLFAEKFWKRLTCRSKWHEKVKPLEVGDLVVVVDPMSPKNVWPRGKVVEVFRAADGQVRKAKVMMKSGVLERPLQS